VDRARLRTALVLYGGVLLGVAWLVVALLARFQEGFVLYGPFRDLGLAFWLVFTGLGVVLVATLSWAALGARDPHAPTAGARAATPGLGPVPLAPGFNPIAAPTGERDACARCGRRLPPWRMPEGTCTVCAPFSVFLDKPRKPSPELEQRRTRLFLLQGLGLALLALAFVSAVYLFPIVLAPQRPVLATLGFLVFSPLAFGLVLLMYAHEQNKPAPSE
jgi:hypothetical protein